VKTMLSMLKTTLLHILVIGARANVVEDVITWVQSEGGSFNQKLEIRRMVPHDISSPYGVYAKENIDAKESLMIIPTECYIQIHSAEDMNIDEGWEEPYHKNLCNLSHKLMKEMKLGEESNYAPYIAYLKTQERGQLPANWSEPGKHVLKQFFPKGHQVVDWIDQNFKQNNCIGDDPFEEHMVEMTIQRCFDVSLIPIWDMVNHDNGRINTENDSMYEREGLKVRASKDINAGDQIYATYDKCVDCMSIADIFGTSEILKDFGFVEDYPHRYVYMDQDIWFEIHNEDAGLTVHWDQRNVDDDDELYPEVTEESGLEFLKEELSRIHDAAARLLNKQGDIPDREWDTIYNYYMAVSVDLHTVIKAVKDTYAHEEL